MPAVPSTWPNTKLWQRIRGAAEGQDAIVRTIKNSLPLIERVLKSAGTSMPDFTLHDDEHSFRVAERIIELIPGQVDTKIGSIELALLLFAAYLHDIGMSPGRDVVQRHYRYLLTAEPTLLSAVEISALQRWLREQSQKISARTVGLGPRGSLVIFASVIEVLCT